MPRPSKRPKSAWMEREPLVMRVVLVAAIVAVAIVILMSVYCCCDPDAPGCGVYR